MYALCEQLFCCAVYGIRETICTCLVEMQVCEVLGTKPRALHVLGKPCATVLHPQATGGFLIFLC